MHSNPIPFHRPILPNDDADEDEDEGGVPHGRCCCCCRHDGSALAPTRADAAGGGGGEAPSGRGAGDATRYSSGLPGIFWNPPRAPGGPGGGRLPRKRRMARAAARILGRGLGCVDWLIG